MKSQRTTVVLKYKQNFTYGFYVISESFDFDSKSTKSLDSPEHLLFR